MSANTVPGSRGLLLVGTVVSCRHEGYSRGVVQDYEYSRVTQSTFPVAFGPVWRSMNLSSVTVLGDQPKDRRLPRRTGAMAVAPTAAVAMKKRKRPTAKPAEVRAKADAA